jgi:hypothetical protein
MKDVANIYRLPRSGNSILADALSLSSVVLKESWAEK